MMRVSLSPLPASPPSFHTTVFPITDDATLLAADQLIAKLKAEHYYTDTSSFDLTLRRVWCQAS